MHLRKTLTLAAAVLAAGVLTLTAVPAHATGGPIGGVTVTNPTTGTFKDGTASFAGGTFGCIGGNVTGSTSFVSSGLARTNFTALNITCSSPVGVDATISIGANCARANWADDDVHNGYVDYGPDGPKYSAVTGTVTLDASCGEIAAGPCEADVSGTVAARFWERKDSTVATQALVINGPGFTLNNQNFWCLGLLTGGVTLNNIRFNFPASTIDFRP